MRPNQLQTLWATGQVAVNGWLHTPSAWSAEVMAHAGWDSLTVDLQHGLADYETAVAIFQAIATTNVVPLARVAWKEPVQMMRLLDAGAYGIICPMINNRAEAEAFIRACRYPPLGYRSLGPTRARLYAGDDYAQHANETIITLAMVETQTALDNLPEILTTPGLDGVFVGPGDLGFSLTGQTGMDMREPQLAAALAQIAQVTRAHSRVAGIWVPTASDGQQMRQLGYQLITLSSDSRLLASAAQTIIRQLTAET